MVVLGVGEAFSETISDKVTVYKGPGDFKTSGKVTPLVLIKASAFQYIASSGPDGVVTHTAGPTSKCARSRTLACGIPLHTRLTPRLQVPDSRRYLPCHWRKLHGQGHVFREVPDRLVWHVL